MTQTTPDAWVPLNSFTQECYKVKAVNPREMRKQSPDRGAAAGPGLASEWACPAHCRYSSSSTLMTLVGMEGRGCCSTSEPNHLARPTGELLLWLGRCSSWGCTRGRPDRLGTLWGVVWTLTAAAWEPEPGGWRTVETRRKVLIQSTGGEAVLH